MNGTPVATRLQVRVLSTRFGRRYTSRAMSPIVGPERPPAPPKPPGADPNGDCDNDGALNGDRRRRRQRPALRRREAELRCSSCKADTDGDGVEDGYEYQSARDLNDDEYQEPQTILPAPEKRPYPNPLFAGRERRLRRRLADAARQEYALWKALPQPGGRTLNDLVYSDGNQYSAYGRDGTGRRPGGLVGPDPHAKYSDFFAWASRPATDRVGPRSGSAACGCAAVRISGHGDGDRGFVRPARPQPDGASRLRPSALLRLRPGRQAVRRRARRGRRRPDELRRGRRPDTRRATGPRCYKSEKPYPITYAGTDLVDPDTDGDSVRDGADDQDHDDVPNLMELSRWPPRSGVRGVDGACGKAARRPRAAPGTRPRQPVQPVPAVRQFAHLRPASVDRRTAYAPFDDSPNYLILN